MNKEKFNAVVQYFTDMNIELPTDVKNSIEDVFSENDNIEDVECYHKEDLNIFQTDMTIKNTVNMYLNGRNTGDTTNVFTYYGSVSYALSESINLYDNDNNLLEDISNINTLEETVVDFPKQYVVVVLEKVNWDSETEVYIKEPKLYIYCPETVEEETAESKIREEIENGDF